MLTSYNAISFFIKQGPKHFASLCIHPTYLFAEFFILHMLCVFSGLLILLSYKKKKKIDIKLDRHKRQSKQYLVFSFNERIYNFQYKYNINKWLMVEYLISYKSTIKIIPNNNYRSY